MESIITEFIINEIHGGRSDLEINPADDLLSSSLLGSLDMMRLIDFLEQQFEIKVAPDEMTIDNFLSVEAMCTYLRTKISELAS